MTANIGNLRPKKLNRTVRFCLEANEVFPIEISDDDVLNAWSTQEDELASICEAQVAVTLYGDVGGYNIQAGDSGWTLRGLEHSVGPSYQKYRRLRGKQIRRTILLAQTYGKNLSQLSELLSALDVGEAKDLAYRDVLAAMRVYADAPSPCHSSHYDNGIGKYSLFSHRRQPRRSAQPIESLQFRTSVITGVPDQGV
jgi:hypothetical protein